MLSRSNFVYPGTYYAYRSAHLSPHKKRMGAALMRGAKCLGIGVNQTKTNPKVARLYTYTACGHAEYDVIRRVGLKRAKGAVVYVTRLLKNGSVAMSRPCNTCRRLLEDVGVAAVVWTNEHGGEVYDVIY